MRVLLLALAACAAPVAPAAPPSPTDPCGADAHAGLVGTNVAAVTPPADLDARIVGPDTVVTMDHRPERLNVETDADGTITALRCG